MQLDRLVSSQHNFEKHIKETIQKIKQERDTQSILKKVILFCKHSFSVNGAQRKKFLCLQIIRAITDNFRPELYENVLDDNIPAKLLKTITTQMVNMLRESKNEQEKEYSERLVEFAIETIVFWRKKLSFVISNSQFGAAYNELKNSNAPFPKGFSYYKTKNLVSGIWGQSDKFEHPSEEPSPTITMLFGKFEECKTTIQDRINESLEAEQDIILKSVLDKLRDFLLAFFLKYRKLVAEPSQKRDTLTIYFHIISDIYKKVHLKLHIPGQELALLTKEAFKVNHSSDFSTINRMDIVNLACLQKYNALSIFQRIHARIEEQENRLGECTVIWDKDIISKRSYPSIKESIKFNKDLKKDVSIKQI